MKGRALTFSAFNIYHISICCLSFFLPFPFFWVFFWLVFSLSCYLPSECIVRSVFGRLFFFIWIDLNAFTLQTLLAVCDFLSFSLSIFDVRHSTSTTNANGPYKISSLSPISFYSCIIFQRRRFRNFSSSNWNYFSIFFLLLGAASHCFVYIYFAFLLYDLVFLPKIALFRSFFCSA